MGFDRAATFVDLRALEYAGLAASSPLDVAVGASGGTVDTSSGSVTTRNANDLLVAGNVVTTHNVGPGRASRRG